MKDFQHKNIVITGAASGIGKALAVQLAALGANLAILDIDKEGLQATAQIVSQYQTQVHAYPVDIAQKEQVKQCLESISAVFDHIDLLINNAGISISSYFSHTTISDFEKVVQVNFMGTVYCTRFFMPLLKKSPAAQIVNVISNFSLMGIPGKTAYASTKGALLAFSNALYTEYYGSSIKVSVVIPPAVDTQLVRKSKTDNPYTLKKEIEFMQKSGMPVAKVARSIIRGIKKGKYRIRIGLMIWVMDTTVRLFPTFTHQLIGRMKHKIPFA